MIWAWICHALGFDYGLPYGHLGLYNMWSGFGSDVGEVVIIGGLASMFRKHNCHVHGCWRIARHPVEGTSYVVCRRHHPAGPPTHQDVVDAHAAAVAQVSGGAGSNPAGAGLPADPRVVPPPAATSQVSVPQQLLDDIRKAPRKAPGGDRP